MAIFIAPTPDEKAKLKNFIESDAIKDLIRTTGSFDQVFVQYRETLAKDSSDVSKLAIYLSTFGIDINELPAYFETTIPPDAFAYTPITNPKFSDTLIMISTDAFVASAIETLILPASIKVIDKFAFYRCEKLRVVEFPDTHMTLLSRIAFENCEALQKFTLPRSWDDSLNFSYLPDSCDIYYRGTIKEFKNNHYSNFSLTKGKVPRIIQCSDGNVET